MKKNCLNLLHSQNTKSKKRINLHTRWFLIVQAEGKQMHWSSAGSDKKTLRTAHILRSTAWREGARIEKKYTTVYYAGGDRIIFENRFFFIKQLM